MSGTGAANPPLGLTTSKIVIVGVLKLDIQTFEEVPTWLTKRTEEGRSTVKVLVMAALKACTAIAISIDSLETIFIFNLMVFIKNDYK